MMNVLRSVPELIEDLRGVGEHLSPQIGPRIPPFDAATLARALQHVYAAAAELIEFEKTTYCFAPLNPPSEGSPAPRT